MFTVFFSSGLLYKASLDLLNMFIGLESHTLIVTYYNARPSYGDLNQGIYTPFTRSSVRPRIW